MFKSMWDSFTKILREKVAQKIQFRNIYRVECWKPDGTLRWAEEIPNIVVNVGLNDVLDKYFKGVAYTAAHYVGITSATPVPNAADTMASHSGWTEVTDYDEADRPALTLGAVSAQSVNNSGNKAVYTINATVTIGGAFVTTDDTKGGSAGTLYGVAAFTNGNRAAQDGDELRVTCTLSAASA